MSVSDDALAQSAAILTAAIIEQDAIYDPEIRGLRYIRSHAVTTFGEILGRLREERDGPTPKGRVRGFEPSA